MKVADPDFVCGKKGRFELQPPIEHPPFCVCTLCPKYRQKAAEKQGKPIEELWPLPFIIRARRASPHPDSRAESGAAARAIKKEEEERLSAAVKQAEADRLAKQTAISFGQIVDAYRRHVIEEGKRYDRAKSLINKVETVVGRQRDAQAVDISVYRAVLSTVAGKAAETRRHYGSMLIAIMNFGKAEGLISSHSLNDVRLPTVIKNDAPVTWTKRELAIIMGPALEEWERGQGAWNEKVGNVEGTGSLRTASYLPLRGLILIAYYTLMRPNNNFALMWEEVTLDPEKRTGFFRLQRHKNARKGIKARGPINRPLVEYLLAIRPQFATGLIHPNPATGAPYTNIRKQWDRLIAIAARMLGYLLQGRKGDFFTFRHTGASHLAQQARDGAHIIKIVKMMGDTNVKTVEKHYFNFDDEMMADMIEGWEVPTLESLAQPLDMLDDSPELTN
jgi:integrase